MDGHPYSIMIFGSDIPMEDVADDASNDIVCD